MRAVTRRALRSDERGLSTVEYVIVLVVIGLVGIAAWRGLGTQTASRALEAQQEVGALGESVDGPGASRSGAHAPGRTRSRVEDATAEQAPPPSASEELFGPVMLIGGAAVLVLALVARRMLRKGGGGGQGGGGAAA
jgi:Flp pilus assembly pilin Flp